MCERSLDADGDGCLLRLAHRERDMAACQRPAPDIEKAACDCERLIDTRLYRGVQREGSGHNRFQIQAGGVGAQEIAIGEPHFRPMIAWRKERV